MRATSSKTCEHNVGIEYFIVRINLCSFHFVLLFILSDWSIPTQTTSALHLHINYFNQKPCSCKNPEGGSAPSSHKSREGVAPLPLPK